MKGIQKFYSKAMLYLKRSSPTILTCVGAAGVIATAVMAVKATPKAMRICAVLKSIRTDDYEEEPTKFEYALAAWRCYIPSAIMGLSTISCIFGANALNKRQQAAITSAYILMENAYKEYKNKAKELLGDKTDFQIREAVAKGKYNECHPAVEKKQLYYMEYYGKYFETTKEDVLLAEYRLNRDFTLCGYAALNDFYELLGLEKSESGEVLGWTLENSWSEVGEYPWVDFEHETVTMDDGLECCIITFTHPPTADYLSY